MHLGPHHHGHSHACGSDDHHGKWNRAFGLAVLLNVLLVVAEALGGFWTGSMALLADAGHNLSDVAGLVLAWGAHWLRGKGRQGRWTYGWRSFTILAANLNGVLLVVAIVGVSYESIHRLMAPSPIAEVPVLVVAAIAALLNLGTARLLLGGGSDLNVRGAYLHMLADAAVSVAVVVGALLIMATGWNWIDPAVSLAICAVLTFGTWQLLRESTEMMMHAAPREFDLAGVQEYLRAFPEVANVVDLHIWSVSTTDVLLTAKLHCPGVSAADQDAMLREMHAGLDLQYCVSHATLEVFRDEEMAEVCALERS